MALTEADVLLYSSIGLRAFAESLEEQGVKTISVEEMKRAANSMINRHKKATDETMD